MIFIHTHTHTQKGYFDRGHCCFMLWRMMEASVLLAITGVVTALITLAVNVSVYYFTPLRFLIVSSLDTVAGATGAAALGA